MGKADADGPGLPDLPPEWGRVVVPDDASALADEAEQLRRERRRRTAGHHRRWRPPAGPVLVLVIAVLTTIAGLAVVTWPRAGRSPGPATSTPDPAPAQLTGRPLPALDLVDVEQSPVALRGLLPAVVLLVDGCACPGAVAEAAAMAPAGVNVVTVAGVHPRAAPAGTRVRALADPAGGLRAFLHFPASQGAVTALLVDRSGRITLVVPELDSIADHQAELVRLAG
ncbi:hypothetical protein SAMN05443287_114128 [Micromonospora phaseoli]|uniref:Thioredoxin domain-containing protein n=1 Tax=Micromonospora phaseoli TaxID=1144548 RepID=A0A1H7DJB1_9ACTN|nr:hypothetical protein [Micromonospora phaseoli]PZW02407.1 hypothetical protein CLV64_102784 [Micromonospora phaseoli]GIJ75592.1 hypothetical protein Xph01_00240 [Micromonospora phaseoli]SEK01879.1 hypothetical protein SAMN05443287_114128 [Micromonospora phaseoli]